MDFVLVIRAVVSLASITPNPIERRTHWCTSPSSSLVDDLDLDCTTSTERSSSEINLSH